MASVDSSPMAHLLERSSSSKFSCSSLDASDSDPDSTPLRVFLVQTAKGLFSSSGGYKANLCFLRYLASRGHSVRQLCYSHRDEVDNYIRSLTRSGRRDLQYTTRQLHLTTRNCMTGIDVNVSEFVLDGGVEIVALDRESFDEAFGGKENVPRTISKETADYIENGNLSTRLFDFVSFLQREIREFTPTHVMFNDGLSMQATSALQMPDLRACRIAVIHTAEQLPFGPFYGGMPGHVSSPSESTLLHELDGIWSVSEAISRYALEHGRLATKVFAHHPWTYLEETTHQIPDHRHNWNKRFVGMINPCKVKGFQILVSLARLCPQHEFLVYKSWGFDEKTKHQLENLQNVTVRSSCTDMEEAWRDMKILLVPSLWFEAWGMVVIEAHIRGIPVISSDVGALTEAMLGLEHVIPVNPIRGTSDGMGEYVMPEQNVGPWVEIVDRVMTDKSKYEELSAKARSVTEAWLREIDQMALESWLGEMLSLAKNRGRF